VTPRHHDQRSSWCCRAITSSPTKPIPRRASRCGRSVENDHHRHDRHHPTRAETGYGYIEKGEDSGRGVFGVRRFIEKPTFDRARCSRPLAPPLEQRHVLLLAWPKWMPFFASIYPSCRAGLDQWIAPRRSATSRPRSRSLPTLPSISIDHGVMKKRAGCGRSRSFGWSDVGSWQTSWELATKDADGNAAPESAVSSTPTQPGPRPFGDRRAARLALVGVDNLAVVITDGGHLVIRAAALRT